MAQDSDYYSDSFCDTGGEEDTRSMATQQHTVMSATEEPRNGTAPHAATVAAPAAADHHQLDAVQKNDLHSHRDDGTSDSASRHHRRRRSSSRASPSSSPSSSASSRRSTSASPSRKDRLDASSSWEGSPERSHTPPVGGDHQQHAADDNAHVVCDATLEQYQPNSAFNSTLPASRSNPLRAAIAVSGGDAAGGGGRRPRRIPPSALAGNSHSNSHSDSAFEKTLNSTGGSGSRHRKTNLQHDSPSRQGASGGGDRKKMLRSQKYAVEEGIFAPLHAAIDDTRLTQLVTRLYDPEPLRQLTYRAVDERRDKITHESYDSVKDSHLAPYWQRKVVFKNQLRNELAIKQQQNIAHSYQPPPTSLTPLPSQHSQRRHTNGGTKLPHLSVRPATCPIPDDHQQPPGVPHHHTKAEGPLKPVESLDVHQHNSVARSTSSFESHGGESSAGECLSPNESSTPAKRNSRRRKAKQQQHEAKDGTSPASSRSNSSVGSESAASSPEWKEQRPGSAPRVNQHAKGGMDSPNQLSQSLPRHPSASRSHRTAGGSTTRSSMIARVTTVKRKDLYALWMAARPPSPFQRLVSRLSYNPSQEFSLGWLVQKKSPPAGGTLREVPVRPPPRDDASSSGHRVRISSPRSAYVMLRQGIMVEDITPVSLQRFYLEGSLQGVPAKVAEFHFAAREKKRKALLDEILRAYDAICATVTQEAFVQKLYAVNPEENRQALLSREDETICGGPKQRSNPSGSKSGSKAASRSSSASALRTSHQVLPSSHQANGSMTLPFDAAADPTTEGGNPLHASSQLQSTGAALPPPPDASVTNGGGSANEADDTAAAKRRIELTIQKQQRRQDKYMQQLARNAQLLRERATENKKREEVSQVKQERLVQKREEVSRLRKEEQSRREQQLKEKRIEAMRIEKDRQDKLLEKIKKGEEHAVALSKKREEIRVLQHEERKILEETKIEIVARREKQLDYENLLLIDRIRRKAGRAQSMQEMKEDAMMMLKERRERNLIEMGQRTEEFAEQLLAYERKNLTN